MAEDVMVKDEACNSCCQMWKEKCTKLKDRCSKLENARNALREALSILEQQINKLQAENLSLKKAYEDERTWVETEKEEKEKESAARVTLETEVSALRSEIVLLQENGRLVGKGVDQEVPSLKLHILEAETEINQLKELLEKERKRVDEQKEKLEMERKKAEKALEKVKVEKKKAMEEKRVDEQKEKLEMERKKAEKALEKVKVEKKKAMEEKRLTDIERTKEEFRLRFETLKCEADEAKSKLALETARCEQANKKLKAERESTRKERERADREMTKAEDQRKLAEANWKKAMDERRCANQLSQQLDQNKKRLDELEKESVKLVSTRKLVEIPVEQGQAAVAGELGSGTMNKEANALVACKKLEELEEKIIRVTKQVKSEMKNAEEQRRVAEAYKMKAMEEKNRADRLSCELEGHKQMLEGVQKEIQELVSSGKVFESCHPASGGSLKEENAEIKLLRKQLKFEKVRVKHAKEVAKMEVGWNQILREEVHCIKQEFTQRFDILDKCLFLKCEGRNNQEKMGGLNLEQENFCVKLSQMIPHTENEFVKPSCTSSIAAGGSGPVKQNKKCIVQLPPVSGERCTSPITGIVSNLELLLRGSNRKMLQTSAINSSSASFSDRPLMGSQERDTFSVSTSALLAEERNLEPTSSCLFVDARKGSDEKLAVGAENSVGSPVKFGATARTSRHRKRKRLPDAVESIESLYSAGQKWHQQVLQKLSVLHGMLNGESSKTLEEERLLVPKLQGNICSELLRPHKKNKASCVGVERQHSSELKTNLETLHTEVFRHVPPTECNTSPELRDGVDDLLGNKWHLPRNYEEGLDWDYMKLVDLDNDEDEKSFRKAIEEPVSPLSPALCNIEFPCTKEREIEMHTSGSSPDRNFYGGDPMMQENLEPSCSFDVINMEIDSNERTLEGLGNSKSLSFGMSKPHNEPSKTIGNIRSSDSGIMCTSIVSSGQIQNLSMLSAAPRDEDLNILCESRSAAFNRFPQFCAISSNNIGRSSIFRIFDICSELMSQFSGNCSIKILVQNIVLSLEKAVDLSAGERVSVFFSLLLHYIPGIINGDFRSFSDLNSLRLMDSFAQPIHAVLNDVDTRRMFLESCDVGELLVLIEDFLLNRIILVYDDVSHRKMHGCDSRAKVVCNGNCIFWSIGTASIDLMFAGGLLLASICAPLDQIGFICEVSYNLFSTRKIDFSFLLWLVHVFAYLCGPKYFTLKDYSLQMYVLKSLVGFFERSSSADAPSCMPPMFEMSVKISACSTCPFLEDVASVEFVVSVLLEKLQNYALSGAEKQDPRVELLSSNSVSEFDGMRTADVPCHRGASPPNFVSDQYLCCFIDILSLVELVASVMTWEWTFGNIISRLLQMLDSFIPGHIFPAIITLLGQLGRIGVDAKGYEDSEVDSLRDWLIAFLRQNTFGNYDLSVQFASATALVGLIPRSFKEVLKSNFDLPATISQSVAVDCVRNWFSSLTKEQQSSFRSLHSSSKCVSTTEDPASNVAV